MANRKGSLTCEECGSLVGNLYYDRETRLNLCDDCFHGFTEDEDDDTLE